MIQLYSHQSKAFPNTLGIWLAIQDGSLSRHVGIAYRVGVDSPALVLHLGFHHQLHHERAGVDHGFATEFAWIDCPGFDEDEKLQLAVWLESIWKTNGSRVPYGLAYSGAGYFEAGTGLFVAAEVGAGLTCATFVMAAFADLRFEIVDWKTWPQRDDGDADFQLEIAGVLERHVARGLAEKSHVDAQIAALGTAVRFRPEEVVASGGSYAGSPVVFSLAEPLSRQLMADLSSLV